MGVFGFKPMLDYMAQGHACYQMYTESLAAGSATEAEVETLEHGSLAYVLSAPLQRTTFAPVAAVVYGNAAQSCG